MTVLFGDDSRDIKTKRATVLLLFLFGKGSVRLESAPAVAFNVVLYFDPAVAYGFDGFANLVFAAVERIGQVAYLMVAR
jgi:hypothetical protein